MFVQVLRHVYPAAGERGRRNLLPVVRRAIDTLERIYGPQMSVEALRDEALREARFKAWCEARRDDLVWEEGATLNGVKLHPRVKRLVVLTDERPVQQTVSQGPADRDKSMWKQPAIREPKV